jgi:hypothetical protein
MSGKINVRKIELEDYEFINKWWVEQGFVALEKDILPMNGLGGLIIEKEKPIAAAYLYITNSKVGYIDNLITDPKYVSKDRFDIILMLIQACEQMANEVGCLEIWAMTENEGIIQRCKALGYNTSERSFARVFSTSPNLINKTSAASVVSSKLGNGDYVAMDEEEIDKGIQKINEQVESSALTKEQSKEQFVAITEQLGLKHSFSFDEAWEIGEEIRSRNEFRDNIVTLENQIINTKGALVGKELHEANPVKHTFAGGCYIREIYNPANELIITKIHKKEHPFFLMKGEMSILTEEGIQRIKAPYQGITKPGTKRAIYTHEECIFITVHATENTTIEDAEDEVICTKYEDLPPGCDALEILKKINLKQ